MKALKIAGGLVGAVAVVLVLALAFGLPASVVTAAIQDRVERDTGYRLSIAGSASISLWPSLHATLTDITLLDPKDRDGNNRLTVAMLQADMALSGLWSGRPDIAEVIVDKPTLYLPLLRERLRDNAPRNRAPAKSDAAPSMTRSWLEGRPIETATASTVAEGIATRVPVPRALELMDSRIHRTERELWLAADGAGRRRHVAVFEPDTATRPAQAELRS